MAQEGKGTREGASGSKQPALSKMSQVPQEGKEPQEANQELIEPQPRQISEITLFFSLFKAPDHSQPLKTPWAIG